MAIIRACKMIRGEIKQGHFNPRANRYPGGMRGYLLWPFIDPKECNWKVIGVSLVAPWYYLRETAHLMFDDKQIDKKDDHGVKVKGETVNSGSPSTGIFIFSVITFNFWIIFELFELYNPGLSVLGWVS